MTELTSWEQYNNRWKERLISAFNSLNEYKITSEDLSKIINNLADEYIKNYKFHKEQNNDL